MKLTIKDIFPEKGHVQRLYCDDCNTLMDLTFIDFDAEVTGVHIIIEGLPFLKCHACGKEHWTERSRFAVIKTHENAIKAGNNRVFVKRQKIEKSFGFTEIPFVYDPDDYHYIPGLSRPFNEGFLTPVFFNRSVLLKFDTRPDYRLKFVSKTYGSIINDDKGFIVAFGLNRKNLVVMWLGDIAELPESEQYYLKSENVPSDHCLGSEFYEGQLECVFTERSPEDKLFKLRSEFIDICYKKFGQKIAQLEEEVLDRALDFNEPVVDTKKERRHISNTMDEIYVESLNTKALKKLAQEAGVKELEKLKGLKLFQVWLQALFPNEDVHNLVSPFFILNDLRIANAHISSMQKQEVRMLSVFERMSLKEDTGFIEVYCNLRDRLTESYERLKALMYSMEK